MTKIDAVPYPKKPAKPIKNTKPNTDKHILLVVRMAQRPHIENISRTQQNTPAWNKSIESNVPSL